MAKPGVRRNQVSLWPLVMAIFFCVAGGPFGLESLVQESGPTIAVILIVVTPIFWGAPVALMTAELASALPSEGGYYVWVERAFGPFFGFQCAWWTWIYSWIDVAIYPVQFTEYVGTTADLLHLPHLWSESHPWLRWLLGLLVVIPCTILNIRGAKPVGKTALILGLLTLAPFVAFFIAGLNGVHSLPSLPLDPRVTRQAFGSGLFIVMWNYLGWDSMSTIAEEVQEPSRTFPKAILIAMPIIVATYLVPVLVGWSANSDTRAWGEGSWPTLALRIGGPTLAISVAVAAVFAQVGQFMSNLLGVSRAPMTLAQENRLPSFLGKLHPRYGTPWLAVLSSAAIYTVLSFQAFQDLVKFDVLVYSGGLLLELGALAWLRKIEPELPRPFRIPGGWPVILGVSAAPAIMIVFAILHSVRTEQNLLQQAAILAGALASGPILFYTYPKIQLLLREIPFGARS